MVYNFYFRCVDEVVIGAPYAVTKNLMEHFKVRGKYSRLVFIKTRNSK